MGLGLVLNGGACVQEQHGGSGPAGAAGAAGAGAGAGRGEPDEEEPPNTPGADSGDAVLKKREFVLRELVDTEEIYVTDLRLICEGYMRHMQVGTNTSIYNTTVWFGIDVVAPVYYNNITTVLLY